MAANRNKQGRIDVKFNDLKRFKRQTDRHDIGALIYTSGLSGCSKSDTGTLFFMSMKCFRNYKPSYMNSFLVLEGLEM